jgi:hypothetical protein
MPAWDWLFPWPPPLSHDDDVLLAQIHALANLFPRAIENHQGHPAIRATTTVECGLERREPKMKWKDKAWYELHLKRDGMKMALNEKYWTPRINICRHLDRHFTMAAAASASVHIMLGQITQAYSGTHFRYNLMPLSAIFA